MELCVCRPHEDDLELTSRRSGSLVMMAMGIVMTYEWSWRKTWNP